MATLKAIKIHVTRGVPYVHYTTIIIIITYIYNLPSHIVEVYELYRLKK